MKYYITGIREASEKRIAANERQLVQRMLESSLFTPALWRSADFLSAVGRLLHALTLEDGKRADLVRQIEELEAERDAALVRVGDMIEVIRAVEVPERLFAR